MRLRSIHVAALLVVILFGTIGVTALTGAWITESTKVPRRISTGEFVGSADPADIRGSYTFGDIENAFGIPATLIADAFALSGSDPALYAAKDLEEVYGEIDGLEVGTDSLRLFVSLSMGIPYTPEETTALPARAYELLVARGTDDVSAYVDRIVAVAGEMVVVDAAAETAAEAAPLAEAPASTSGGEASTHETEPEEGVVKGATTFADVLDWGLTREQVEAVIGRPMPARATRIRDFAADQGASFGAYREALQQLLDALE